MGKIVGKIIGILSIFLFILFLSFQAPVALAADEGPQDTCDEIIIQEYQKTDPPTPLETDPKKTPTLVLSDHKQFKQARFIIQDSSINNNSVEYKMDFRCKQLLSVQMGQTAITQNPYIYLDLDRHNKGIGDPCEFSKGPREIWVTAGNYKICRASYEVIDADTLCKLSIPRASSDSSSPDFNKSAMPAKDLQIQGENLTRDRQFRLFFDNQLLKLRDGRFPPDKNYYLDIPVFTENLSGISQPPPFLTRTGKHRVDIRRYYSHLNPVPFFQENGPALCPLDFIVESPDKPVKILDEKDLKACVGGPLCASGAGEECIGGTKPSIKTAIGCIHTNPADLIQDVLKFGVGIGGGLAFLMMLLGAFQMLTSAGNPETLQAGKDRLTSSVIGLLIIIFAVLLLQIIGFDILGIPGFGRS